MKLSFARSVVRSLRFRLTLTYVLFLALLLTAVGILFRQTLSSLLDERSHEAVEEAVSSVRAYLRIEDGRAVWFYDPRNPQEAFTVERLRRIFLLADANGRVLEYSNGYSALGIDSQWEMLSVIHSGVSRWEERADPQRVRYLILARPMSIEGKVYFVALGRSIEQDDLAVEGFTRNYFTLVPLLLLCGTLLGWFMAGRALRPVSKLASTVQNVSGSQLDYRIPPRGADDELDQVIDSFNHMMERLQDSFEQIRRFSVDVSHELRTPITATRGQLEVALMTAKTAEDYRVAVVDALQCVERLSRIVKALLLLSQAESGQLTLRKELFDLTALVRDVAEHFQILADDACVVLRLDLPETCLALVDRVQIDRLISNLLSNALKYTSTGGEVVVKMGCREEVIDIVVKDTGCGISPEHLPHIFDRLYRAPGSDYGFEKSFGLGLSFVDWIVRAHQGKMHVQSSVGVGSVFTIELPAPPANLLARQKELRAGTEIAS